MEGICRFFFSCDVFVYFLVFVILASLNELENIPASIFSNLLNYELKLLVVLFKTDQDMSHNIKLTILLQMTIISITVGKNPLEEME